MYIGIQGEIQTRHVFDMLCEFHSFTKITFSSIICTNEMAWSSFHRHFKMVKKFCFCFLIIILISGALDWPQKMETNTFFLFANRNALGVIEQQTETNVYVTHSELFFVEVRITIFIYF